MAGKPELLFLTRQQNRVPDPLRLLSGKRQRRPLCQQTGASDLGRNAFAPLQSTGEDAASTSQRADCPKSNGRLPPVGLAAMHDKNPIEQVWLDSKINFSRTKLKHLCASQGNVL